MANVIAVIIVVVVVGAAIIYLKKSAKNGIKCVGCPSAGSCPHSGKGCGTDHSVKKAEATPADTAADDKQTK